MAQLNHTIVWCSHKQRSADFLTEILGVPPARPFLHFLVVELDNGVSLDYFEKSGSVSPQHYAFLVSDPEFDAGFDRIKQHGVAYWADPARSQPGQINTHFGGRGVYFADPDEHLMELITTPYGSEAEL
jgi:catechol 2,3-dioxygenase-like lactoylglutathione lyase family enzyme